MHKTHKTSRFLAIVLLLAMLMSIGVYATDAQVEAPATALNADEPTLISMDSSETIVLTFPLSKAQVGAYNAADEITWTLTRNETYANAGEIHPVNGETVMFPNEVQSVALEDLTYSGSGAFKVTSVEHELDGQNLVLTVKTKAAVSRNNNSVIHGEGGAYLDVSGCFTLTGMADNVPLAEKDNVVVKPYASFHTMWEIYAEITALAAEGDDDAATAKPYVVEDSMGTSTAGYNMPYLIVAKDSKAVVDWLTLCEKAETEPEQVLADLKAGKYDDVKVPVLYSNIHSNEVAAADGIMEFAKLLVEQESIDYTKLTALTEAGKAKVETQRAAQGLHLSSLIEDKTSFLGAVWPSDESQKSGKVEGFDSYYESENVTVTVDELLDDVFFLLVPEQNVEGRLYITRESSNGFDLNRDNSFQVTKETQNMQHFIGLFNPVTHVELHGQVVGFQVEPCDPPHEPNVEYDLLANHLMTGGEAFGAAAVANNEDYQSYVIPERDYLYSDDDGNPWWADPWDDMSTSYTPQFAMLQGCVAYTVELPAYSESARTAATFGMLGLSDYVAAEKLAYLTDQVTIYQRGANNLNSDASVGPWFTDEHDVVGAEADLFRPAYDGEGENGQFFPEAYLIPLDAANQVNLQAAYDMVEWLTRNDVKVSLTNADVTVNGVTYPAGTAVVSMYQAKRGVANGALYDGTVITGWTTLYSEGITAFNYTRGFDEVVVTKPADYKNVAAAVGTTLDYQGALAWLEANAGSQFSGETDGDVIISNASEDAVCAVNALLKAGKTVGMITEGDCKGDFIVSYADWQSVCSQYVLTGTGVVNADVTAYVIGKSPVVYIAGAAAKMAPASSGYVNQNYINWNSGGFNYDRWAMDILCFDTTLDASAADAVVGSSGLDAGALAAVQSGATYIGYTSSAIRTASQLLEGVSTASAVRGSMDCLGYVTYPEENLTNASYIAQGDDVLYGYGTTYFTAVPEGAQILVKRDGTKAPLEGFLRPGDATQAFLDGVQAFAYVGADKNGNDVNVTLFANTLTQKLHQRDEFAFISNTLFAGELTDQAYETASPVDPTPQPCDGGDNCPSKDFVDVDHGPESWSHEAIDWAVVKEITKGKDASHFDPEGLCQRAEAVTFLYRAAGEPEVTTTENPFDDVSESDYFYNAVLWAVETGVTKGVDDHTFAPFNTCTRAQIVTFLCRANNGEVPEGTVNPFEDVPANEWYTDAVLWAVAEGVAKGMDATHFDPIGDCTRAQIVTFLFRAQ